MKLVKSAFDRDVEKFRKTLAKLSDSWRTLRYTVKISLMLNENGNKELSPPSVTGDNFSLTLTFLQIVALSPKKVLEVFLKQLDQNVTMKDWLETVQGSHLQIGKY